MKYFVLLIILGSMLVPSLSWGEETEETNEAALEKPVSNESSEPKKTEKSKKSKLNATPRIPAKTFGLLGTFGGLNNFTFLEFDAGINIEYVVIPKLHLRAGVFTGFTFPSSTGVVDDGTDVTETETDLPNNHGIGFSLGATYDLMTTRAVPYVGASLGFRWDQTRGEEFDDVNMIRTTTLQRGVTFSANAILGARVYITDYLTFFAEYTLGFAMTIDRENTTVVDEANDITQTDDLITTIPGFGTGVNHGGQLGIGIYFF